MGSLSPLSLEGHVVGEKANVSNPTLAAIERFYAEELVSDWVPVEQTRIDQFASATLDADWLHIDPECARREAPFGGTIAHGFWSLSVLTHLLRNASGTDYPPGVRFALNYGFDRIRFPAPVPVGARVRGRCRFLSAKDRGGGRILVKTENTVEIEGSDKPAVVAEWLHLLTCKPSS